MPAASASRTAMMLSASATHKQSSSQVSVHHSDVVCGLWSDLVSQSPSARLQIQRLRFPRSWLTDGSRRHADETDGVYILLYIISRNHQREK